MQIIALSGFARSGKDETAKVLVEEFGFKQIAFADKLREMIYALNPIVGGYFDETELGSVTFSYSYLQDVINREGWDKYKEGKHGDEIRRLLQRLGTEAGRQTLWDSIWIDAALTGLDPNAKVVVSDARFFNEFDAVRARGGEVWRIERPGVGPANSHASEMEAIDYPHFQKTLYNSRDLDYFRDLVKQAYGDLVQERAVVTTKQMQSNPTDREGLRSGPRNDNPLGPKKGDGTITSVNVPKRRG